MGVLSRDFPGSPDATAIGVDFYILPATGLETCRVSRSLVGSEWGTSTCRTPLSIVRFNMLHDRPGISQLGLLAK